MIARIGEGAVELFLLWFVFAFIVAIVASSRGRSGAAWFLISAIISPLFGLLFLILLPNLKQQALLERIAAGSHPVAAPAPLPARSGPWLGTSHSRVTVERAVKPFEAEGVYAGVPYRVLRDGSIEAVMQGATVKFQNLEKFTQALG